MEWIQAYDPLHHVWLSTVAAALPIVLLLVTLGLFEWRAQAAAGAALCAAIAVSIAVFGMPARAAFATVIYGAAYGLLPIGWIVLNAVFLFNLTVKTGQFDVVRASVARLSEDRRIQALLIAFSFGAFIEGAAGFGTPVAITGALLIGLGFPPIYAAGLSLITNTAPVAFGAIGTPILTLAAVTGLPVQALSAMAGRQLPVMSFIVPAWLIVTMDGWKGLREVWPAVLISGGSFAIVQFFWSNFVGPELVDIVGGLVSLGALALWCRSRSTETAATRFSRPELTRAWMPWVFLSAFVLAWGLAPMKALLNSGPSGAIGYWATRRTPPPTAWLSPVIDVPALHRRVYRDYPVQAETIDPSRVSEPAYKAAHAEAARFTFNWLSATGTAILFAALTTAMYLRIPIRELAGVGRMTIVRMRWSLVTIALMLALGFVTRYGGTDATLGLAFTRTGWLYPFFAALLGWLGVALTGSDTSSNVLFGSLQKITAQQLGLSPILICASNSTGGVMGKMIDAQSIVVATAATGQPGNEGRILRFVFWHSLALAILMGLLVMAQAYLVPWMVPEE